MAIDVKPEIPRAVLEGGKNPGVNPAEKEAVRLFKENVKVKGPRTATEEASARKIEADSKKAKDIINESIGAQAIDPATRIKPRTSEEEGRFNTANNYEVMFAQFIKEGKGWSGLSDAQKNVLRPDITKEIKKWVNTDTSDYFSGKTDVEVNAIIDKFLTGDIDVFDKVKELYEARLVSPSERIDSATAEKKEEEEETLEDIEEKTKEIEQNQEDQKKQYGVIESFGSRKTIRGKTIKGENRRRLDEIDSRLKKEYPPATLQTLKMEQAQFEREIKQLQERIKAENAAGKAKDNVVLGALRGKLNAAEGNVTDRSNKLEVHRLLAEEKNTLMTQKTDAETQYENLTKEHIAKTTELDSLQKKLHSIRAEIGIAGLDRADAEEAFVASVKNILPDAVSEVFMARIKPMEDAYQKTLDEIEASPDLDPYTKALIDGLRLRYDKFKEDHGFMHRKWRTSETTRVVDEDAIKEDNDELKSGGTDAAKNVMTRVLLKSKNPDTGAKYTKAEAEAFLAANPDFVDKHIEMVTVGLITKGLQTGQVGAKDMEKMVQNGYISDEKMVETFTKSQEMKRRLEKAGVTDSKLKEMGKRVGNKKLWMWLALFALSPLIATGVGAFVIGKDLVKPEAGGGHGKKDEGKESESKSEPASEAETPEAEV